MEKRHGKLRGKCTRCEINKDVSSWNIKQQTSKNTLSVRCWFSDDSFFFVVAFSCFKNFESQFRVALQDARPFDRYHDSIPINRLMNYDTIPRLEMKLFTAGRFLGTISHLVILPSRLRNSISKND